MEIFDFASLIRSGKKKSVPMVIAVGVFDGLHKGHQKILETARRIEAGIPGSESMVITFSHNPKNAKEENIDTMRLRASFASSFGIDSFVVIDFSDDFSRISGSGFCASLLSMTRPVEIVVGSDFRFGHPSSQGTADTMEGMFAGLGADVHVTKVDFVLMKDGEKISSTGLRNLIKNGLFESYYEYVGRRYVLDLEGLSFRKEDGRAVLDRSSIHQILPPEGTYDGILSQGNGVSTACLIDISEKLLSVEGSVGEPDIGSGAEGRKDGSTEKTLLFLRRSSK